MKSLWHRKSERSSAHSPTFPSLHLRHSYSPTLLSLLLRHRIFTYVTWRAAHALCIWNCACACDVFSIKCAVNVILFCLYISIFHSHGKFMLLFIWENCIVRLLKVNTYMYKTIILPVLLYGCETWSLTLRELHTLRVFENKLLRNIFGTGGSPGDVIENPVR